jgi:hypothetical protein
MAHVQLRRANASAPPASKPSIITDGSTVNADPLSNVTARVLPVYYSDNYISLVPGESRTITIEADLAELKDQEPQIVLDGWNIGVANSGKSDVAVTANINAQVDHWPVTGLPIMAHTWK